jgi:putative transcriptional regulator
MALLVDPGTLLAATPQMLDPNFMHTVVLMVQHAEEGAYGLVVNKASTLTVDQLLSDHPLLGQLAFPVHWGGPVGLDTLQILHRVPDEVPGGLDLGGGLYMGGDLDAVGRFLSERGEAARRDLRFLIGYSGWGQGQLEMELTTESWLPAAASADLVFADDQQRTWRAVVRSVGGEASGMEDLPPDVRWN